MNIRNAALEAQNIDRGIARKAQDPDQLSLFVLTCQKTRPSNNITRSFNCL